MSPPLNIFFSQETLNFISTESKTLGYLEGHKPEWSDA